MIKELELVAFELGKGKFVIGKNPDCDSNNGTAKVDEGVEMELDYQEDNLKEYLKDFYKNYRGEKKTPFKFEMEEIIERYDYFCKD
jgi:hypothetical protein